MLWKILTYLLYFSGLTAVETWVVSCIIHVFGVLAEYALILKMIMVGDNQCFKRSLSEGS